MLGCPSPVWQLPCGCMRSIQHVPVLESIANGIYHNRLLGFFLGSTLTGAGVYYYVLEEYKVSNELLTEDIYVRLWISLPYFGNPHRLSGFDILPTNCGNSLPSVANPLHTEPTSIRTTRTHIRPRIRGQDCPAGEEEEVSGST